MKTAIELKDITDSVKAKGENTTLLKVVNDTLVPAYSKSIAAIYMLMEWPLTGSEMTCLRCYAVLMPHGKLHALEVIFIRQSVEQEDLLGEYLGTTKVYSVHFPDNIFRDEYSDQISENIWRRVLGVDMREGSEPVLSLPPISSAQVLQ